MGEIEIEFLPDVAPNHVANFIYLTELGFFDDLNFHRVIPGFMAQGGCPQGSGRGNPGYRFAGEFDSSVKHTRGGLLSMANSGPNTDGSQFFLTFKTTPWLDGKHTIFGKVRAGEDTLKAIEKVGSRLGQTTSVVKIEKATLAIETKGASKKKVEKKTPAKKEPTQKENR
jgi:peptidylprolyl isomerase